MIDQTLLQQIDQRSPAVAWEIVAVTFGNADTDTEIVTGLRPSDPDLIDYQVLQASGPPLVYHDTSSSRRKWDKGIVRLRSTIAGLKAVILLTISQGSEARNKIDGGSKVLARGILPPEIAYEDEANVFMQDQQITKTAPMLQTLYTGATKKAWFGSITPDQGWFGQNLRWNGSAWVLDNTGVSGWGGRFIDSTAGDAFQVLRSGPTGGAVSPATLLALDAIGNLTLQGGLVLGSGGITLLAGQIAFPAAQIPSGGANVLDDYEEGTWTPNDQSGAGLTFTPVVGPWYVKIGRLVVAGFYVQYPATGNAAQARIGGFPFTASGNNGVVSTAYSTYGAPILGYLRENSNRVDLYSIGGAGLPNSSLSGQQVAMVAVYMANA